MTDLPTLQAALYKAEQDHARAVAENSLPRTAEEQAYVDQFDDVMLTAAAAYRAAKREQHWKDREAGAEETRRMFPFLRAVK